VTRPGRQRRLLLGAGIVQIHREDAMELTKDKALWLYDRMVTIRAFEERVAKLFADGRIPGFVHLYAGEEAVAVGVLSCSAVCH
jgi:acetoin:2,6-dichlorophenolindophenol oxidoreductase subunit alpha